MMKGWLKRSEAAKYAGVCLKTLDEWLRDGLDFVKPRKGPILIKRSWLDKYLQQFKIENEKNQIDKAVNETLKGIRT